jgi:16S rRNA (cytosine967-C5)-methyltransferase
VAATVEAARALRRERYAGVVNAVLRRWQRERETLLHRLDADATTRHAFPRWLLDAIARDWPGDAEAILVASNVPATPTLRINRRRGNRESLLARLEAAGHAAQASPWLADAVTLDAHADITRLPGFAEGAFSVQDGAAQLAADLLDARGGMRVLDACAAPGGKAAHVLERIDVELLALDIHAARLARVGENFMRLGLAGKLVAADAAAEPGSWWDGRPFDRILLDAPCSATGVIRRHPDIKLHRRAGDIAPLAATQGSLLARLWPMLAPGGRLLYATCSLLREENEQVVGDFLAAHGDAHACMPGQARGRATGAGWQLLPGIDGVDGMFYAVLDKAVA